MLVHSWSLSSSRWEYQPYPPRRLRKLRRLPSRGDLGTGFDLDTLADDLAGLITELDLHDAAIVAHSMGTCETTRYLARHGTGRISRVVFLGAMTPYLVGASTCRCWCCTAPRTSPARTPSPRSLVTYDGAPHGLYVTHKDAVNTEILGFLAAHDLHRGICVIAASV